MRRVRVGVFTIHESESRSSARGASYSHVGTRNAGRQQPDTARPSTTTEIGSRSRAGIMSESRSRSRSRWRNRNWGLGEQQADADTATGAEAGSRSRKRKQEARAKRKSTRTRNTNTKDESEIESSRNSDTPHTSYLVSHTDTVDADS